MEWPTKAFVAAVTSHSLNPISSSSLHQNPKPYFFSFSLPSFSIISSPTFLQSIMVSPRELLATIESSLLSSFPSPSQRIELMHAIRKSLPSLKSLLSYPVPKASDRAQVKSKEVRLPDSPLISLDDQDVGIALKLSDDLHLNVIDCVRLLVSANQEWGLMGREPIEILRLAAGMWYMERRDIIAALYTLLRAVVLDQGLENDIVTDIQGYLKDLIKTGLRERLINLIKNDGLWFLEKDTSLLQRACTLEAELALLLRISHKYGKSGAQVLFSMGALEHIAACKGGLQRFDSHLRQETMADAEKRHMIIAPILRLVFSLTSLVDTSDFFEVENKVVRETIDFIKGHQLLFDQVLREDILGRDELTREQINLVVGILSKVWPYEENDEYGFVQGLFGIMRSLFSYDWGALSFSQSDQELVKQRKLELSTFRLCVSLISYLYHLVTKKSLRLQVSDGPIDYHAPVRQQQATLTIVGSFLNSLTTAVERAAEEKTVLLNKASPVLNTKIRDINELSRHDVDEIISTSAHRDCISSSDNIEKRRYIAMVDLCENTGARDNLIAVLLPLAEHLLNILLTHFQDGSIASDTSDSTLRITFGSRTDPGHERSVLCGNLVPTLERLESLSEEKFGHNPKVFSRLVRSLKEMTMLTVGIVKV